MKRRSGIGRNGSHSRWTPFARVELLVVFVVVAFVLTPSTMFAATVRVGFDGRYPTISSGVTAAQAGDTVLVAPGIYNEHSIKIDRTITLLGTGEAIIDAGGEGEIITVEADGVHVRNMKLRNVGTSFMEDRAAVRLSGVADCTVENNVLENAFFGIYAENSERCTIRANRLVGEAERESTSGNGIHLWYCRDIDIVDNYVSNHRDGIYFEFVETSSIRGNTSTNNLRYGLHFMFSNGDEYEDNEFVANGAGVAVMYSDHVHMRHNRFLHNWGRASYGLLLKEIRDSEITGNTFHRNTVGIYSEGSNRVQVVRNEFSENGYGVRIMANSMDNEFSENNFNGNTFDVTTNSRQNFNTFSSNYWSQYRGYDLDRDGVGDVPYHPVRLFAILTERQPPGIILMNSLFVRIIDTAERVMPVFTPETLVDDRPLTRAVKIDAF